jgi:hypothetical protein
MVIMVPPIIGARDEYDQMAEISVRTQNRGAPEVEVRTEWFMITNSRRSAARHVDLMFKPVTFIPATPFTRVLVQESVLHETVVLPGQIHFDIDMVYHTKICDALCKELREENGEEGEDLYRNQLPRPIYRKKIIGPPGLTGTA